MKKEKICFNIGDIVRIKKDSPYYGSSRPSNPKDINGVVQDIDCGNLYVYWDNGYANSYREGDLELVVPKSNIAITATKIEEKTEVPFKRKRLLLG